MVNPIPSVPLFQHPTSPPLFQRSLTTLVTMVTFLCPFSPSPSPSHHPSPTPSIHILPVSDLEVAWSHPSHPRYKRDLSCPEKPPRWTTLANGLGAILGVIFWPTKNKKNWIQSFHMGSFHENLRHRVAYKVGNRVGTTHVSGCLSTLSVLVRHHARNDSVVAILSCNQAKLIFQNQQYPCSRWLIWMRAGSQILLWSCTSRHSWCLGVMMMYLHGLKSHKNVWKIICEIWCSCFSCFCRFM